MVSPNASSLPGLVYLDLSENELERFKFFFNPGENGVLKVANGKNSMTLWSWQMLRVTRARNTPSPSNPMCLMIGAT